MTISGIDTSVREYRTANLHCYSISVKAMWMLSKYWIQWRRGEGVF